MARQLTFIHAADLHLGAPFRGLRALSPAWGERLLRAIPEAFGRVVQAAIDQQVDFVVIAGDIFDVARPSYADYRCFYDGVERLAEKGISVYLVAGNHDPYTSWKAGYGTLPDNAYFLSDDKPGYALYRRDGEPMCVLAGRGYYNQSFPVDECVADGVSRAEAIAALGGDSSRAPFAVGVLHTGLDVDTNSAKAPISPTTLMSKDIDYWALGHIHARSSYPKDNPRVCFSGVIQGRDINETGPRGVNLVTLTQGATNTVRFIPCASVVWQQCEVDISACETLVDVEKIVLQRLFELNSQAYCEEMCTRVTLVGATALHTTLAEPGVLEDLRKAINASHDRFFCDALVNKTRNTRNYEALRAADLFPAVVLDTADEQKDRRKDAASYLQAEFAAKGLGLPACAVEDIRGLVDSARDDILDRLEGGAS